MLYRVHVWMLSIPGCCMYLDAVFTWLLSIPGCCTYTPLWGDPRHRVGRPRRQSQQRMGRAGLQQLSHKSDFNSKEFDNLWKVMRWAQCDRAACRRRRHRPHGKLEWCDLGNLSPIDNPERKKLTGWSEIKEFVKTHKVLRIDLASKIKACHTEPCLQTNKQEKSFYSNFYICLWPNFVTGNLSSTIIKTC